MYVAKIVIRFPCLKEYRLNYSERNKRLIDTRCNVQF
jgi:hypothetical protein